MLAMVILISDLFVCNINDSGNRLVPLYIHILQSLINYNFLLLKTYKIIFY